MIKEVTDKNFKNFVKEGVSVVDCFAEWCPPCKMLSPVLENLSGEITEIKFGKLNTDENPEVTGEYEIRSIPNILVFKDGKLIDQIVGFYPEPALKKKLKTYI
ncbi:MAG: thioredoxin [Candidatus Aenigmarchaeota archaeon]|nr:thioredoxin [Candidatus Aenigmarchaeota archaeon]